ncbi:hypothetical protein SAMN05216417_11275 [Nitrosospira multiformis]|uniref:Uncharacterized protein n=1 Tax=Nitrosospira multiformis TaxID=1231 RepID=A0A1I7HXE4_9PROT|nr:hypothetical protein SAMN05216417_11275 [Nitrosospira multiformis]
MHPIAGFVLGGAIGVGVEALSGSLADYGINDDFIVERSHPRQLVGAFHSRAQGATGKGSGSTHRR